MPFFLLLQLFFVQFKPDLQYSFLFYIPSLFTFIMSNVLNTIDDRINNAINDLRAGFYPNAAAAARDYGLVIRTFQIRVKGAILRFGRPAPNYALSEVQELSLFSYIDRLDNIGISPKIGIFIGAANYFLNLENSEILRTVSRKWTKRFIKRHQIKKKKKPLDINRKITQDIIHLQKHFEKFNDIYKELGIQPKDFHNMDETGFRIGYRNDYYILTLNKQFFQLLNDPDNRDYIISIECIDIIDYFLFSFLIMGRIEIQNRWALQNQLDDKIRFSTTDSSYSNDELALQWLQHFDLYISKRQIGSWRLLVMDGYGSHMIWEFLDYVQ